MTVEDNKLRVPNFTGATLPRRDKGDREYYCCAMLTLFKPWRTGSDLKSTTASWDEQFLAHQFSNDEVNYMNNFNIRYECMDARDDYCAQMKHGVSDQIMGSWDSTGHEGEEMADTDTFVQLASNHEAGEVGDVELAVGHIHMNRLRQMHQENGEMRII